MGTDIEKHGLLFRHRTSHNIEILSLFRYRTNAISEESNIKSFSFNYAHCPRTCPCLYPCQCLCACCMKMDMDIYLDLDIDMDIDMVLGIATDMDMDPART